MPELVRDRFLNFVSFIETRVIPHARTREIVPTNHISKSSFLVMFENTCGDEFVSILRSFFSHYASSSKAPIFVRKTFTHHVSVEKIPLTSSSKEDYGHHLMHWRQFYVLCEFLGIAPHASLTVRDIAECFLASTTMQINVEMTRRHVHDNVFKGHKSQTRYVLTHALTEETFFEALVRIGILCRVKAQDSSPWNVQSERCANLLRQGIESSTTNSVVQSLLDLLGRLTREGRRSPELIRDSEFETRHMSLNIRVKKRKRLMQLAAYVLKLRFGKTVNHSAKFLKNGLLFV